MNFDAISAAALAQAPQLLADWFPHGKLEGNEFRIGNINGDPGRSLGVNVRTGKWADFSGTESGHDLIDLRAALVHGGDRVKAARELGDMLGIDRPQHRPQHRPQPHQHRQHEVDYDYHAEDGSLLYQVRRWRLPDGGKTFSQRARIDGSWRNGSGCMEGVRLVPYRLPDLLKASVTTTVYIVEGEKDADNLRSHLLVATCNPGGAGKWLDSYSQYLHGRPVVIIPDNDSAGEAHAIDVQRKLTGIAASVRILRLPGLPPKGDASDWLNAGATTDELERLARTPEPEAPKPDRGEMYGRLKVLSVDDLATATPRDYLVKGIITKDEISLWVGAPKCGKSFLLLYIAYMLSLGRRVFNRRVKAAKVLYVAAEGEGGIANRIEALRRRYGDSSNFKWIAQPVDLLNPAGHLQDLKDAAKGRDLVVIDTLSRVLAGGNENAPECMGTFVKHVTELRYETNAHIAVVHHGTKASNGTNPRGHSSLEGADDMLTEIVKNPDGTRTITVVHAKDDVDGYALGFTLAVVELGTDADGDPITTLIVEEMNEPPAVAVRTRLSDNETIALNCLQKTINSSSIMAAVGDDFAQRAVTTESEWRKTCYRESKPGEAQHTKRMAFTRSRDGLIAKGRVLAAHDYVWIAP